MWSYPTQLKDLEKVPLSYPLIATPLAEGIRFITDNCGIPRDITGEPMINDHVRNAIEEYGMDGLDGRVRVVDGDDYALNEKDGEPTFVYFIGDVDATGLTYRERCDLTQVVPTPRPEWLALAEPVTVYDVEGAENYWCECGLNGYVGITLKQPGRHYPDMPLAQSFQVHMEYTKWVGGLATAVGFTVKDDKLKSITCVDPKSRMTFDVEKGFTLKQRNDIWRDRQVYNTFIVRYQYQPLGTSVPLNARFTKISKR
jgi:hypothetical protein